MTAEKAKNPPLLPREDDFVIKELRLDQIRYDGGTQMRSQRSPATIESYKEKYESGVSMPEPVLFHDGTDFWLADGFQRCEAANAAKVQSLTCRVYQGGRREAVLYACGANESHGLPRDRFAKRRAVLTCMLDEAWNNSNHWIARACNVCHGFVNGIRDGYEEAVRVENNGGQSAVEWAKEYCRNPHAKPGEAVWVPPWKAVAAKPASPSTKEPPIDVPESFRPDPEHSPPPGCGTIRVDDEGLDTYPVQTGDGEADAADEPAVEYRTGIDGVKRPARPKAKSQPPRGENGDDQPGEEALDCYGSDDAPADGEDAASYPPETSTIGEPLNDLTAPAFAQLPEFADLHRVLSDVMKRVDLLYDSGAACFLQYQRVIIDLTNCRNEIYGSRPHALCPECGGEGCHRCRQSGFIPAAQCMAKEKSRKRDDRAA